MLLVCTKEGVCARACVYIAVGDCVCMCVHVVCVYECLWECVLVCIPVHTCVCVLRVHTHVHTYLWEYVFVTEVESHLTHCVNWEPNRLTNSALGPNNHIHTHLGILKTASLIKPGTHQFA